MDSRGSIWAHGSVSLSQHVTTITVLPIEKMPKMKKKGRFVVSKHILIKIMPGTKQL